MKTRSQKHLIWLRRVLKNGWHDLMRNKLLTVATTLIIALMFFVFNLVLGLSFASDSVLTSIGKRVDIRVEILPEVENYTIQGFVNEVRSNPDVSEVVFISSENALSSFGQKYPNVITFLDRNRLKNPLPNVVRIVGSNVEANSRLIRYLENPKFSRIVNQEKLQTDTDQKTRNERIANITQFINRIGFWLNLVFAIVAMLIIFNSININIHNHRSEIQIMQLVGAKRPFIRGGYLVQGLMYGMMALVVSILLSRLTLLYLSKNLIGIITNESLLVGLNAILLHFEDNFWMTFGWQFLGVGVVGLLSSYMAIERYLRRQATF